MWESLREEILETYGDRIVVDNYEEFGTNILERFDSDIDFCSDSQIVINLLTRPYLDATEMDEMRKENPDGHCEAMNWEISCKVTIDLEDGRISDVVIEDRVWGGPGLGDFSPEEKYSDDEIAKIESCIYDFLDAVTLDDDSHADQCTTCGRWSDRLTGVNFGEFVCKSCLDEEYFLCDECGEYWRYDALESIETDDGRTVCAHCAEDLADEEDEDFDNE